MTERARLLQLAGAGLVAGLVLGWIFDWLVLTIALAGPAVALLLLLRHEGSDGSERLARGTWLAPILAGPVILVLFLGSWETGFGWPGSRFDRFHAAEFGLVATLGTSLGMAAMARPRPSHVWAFAPLVGTLSYAGALVLWLLVTL